jgi:FK506-binding protein 4/5
VTLFFNFPDKMPDILKDLDLGNYKIGERCEVTIGEASSFVAEILDKVVSSMKEQETAYIKSRINSRGQKIDSFGGDPGFKFNVTLFEMSRAAESCDLEQDERIERAQHYKDQGTDLFRDGNIDFALKRYQRALDYLNDMDKKPVPGSLKSQQLTLISQCHFNLAAGYLKQEKYDQVVQHCTIGLQTDPNNVKGLFRRGQAYMKLNQYDEAKADYNRALQLDPYNKATANQMAILNGLIRKEKELYKRMF